MAKKAAKKGAKRGAKKAAKRSRKGGARRAKVSSLKMQDLQPLIDDPETCERVTAEKVGPGEWRVMKTPEA